MMHSLSPISAFGLMLLTACGYAIATVGMKMASNGSSPAAVLLIALALAGAALAEIVLLRNGHMSMIYLGIIVAETVLVLGYAALIGHGLSAPQMVGAGLVLVGFALVSTQG